ncbi:hypothetical protein [Polluticoccus soli]|uniref:hypothetical protein n=1 Tax=Polluticoccus soli TaxID=3034150 RepID=UPI0023E2D01D|nr:hypothetical protein [Flavipsychrobacter sp. JY13-12]
MRLPILWLTACAVAFAGCKKETTTPAPAPDPMVLKLNGAFENKTAEIITVDIYHTPNANPLNPDSLVVFAKLTIPPNGTGSLPTSTAITGKTYAYDWYSYDYKLTGWPSLSKFNGLANIKVFDYYPTGSKAVLADSSGNERLIVLNGNGKKSHWKAVDAYDKNGVSVWTTLTASEQAVSFSLDWLGNMVDSSSVLHQRDTSVKLPRRGIYNFLRKDRFHAVVPTVPPHMNTLLSNNLDFIAPLSSSSPDTLFYVVYNFANYEKEPDTRTYYPPYYKIVKNHVDY